MLKYLRHHGEKGQTVILLAFAMIGLLGIVGLALDGGMLYWNQRRAQNGADAAVIAGVTAMAEHTLLEAGCGVGSEQEILNLVQEYANVNEVPDADAGANIAAYYLIEEEDGDRVDLLIPGTGDPWWVGLTDQIPCDHDPVGLRVEAKFPQQTFLAGVVGIAETNVTVEASAIVDYRSGCSDYVLFSLSNDRRKQTLKISGAGTTVAGAGIKSNGGMQLAGGGQTIYLPKDKPIEYSEGGDTLINTGKIECDVILENGDVQTFPCASGDLDIGTGDAAGLGDTFYQWKEFLDTGPIGQEVVEDDPSMYHYIDGDLGDNDVVDSGGNWINGLFVVTGNVQLTHMKTDDAPWRVTIAAKGTIKISGGFSARPYARGVLFFTESADTNNGAIQFSGSSNQWSGMIAAPNGLVTSSGSSNNDLTGMVIGYEIDMSGSNNSFTYHPNICPPDPPSVLLIQ